MTDLHGHVTDGITQFLPSVRHFGSSPLTSIEYLGCEAQTCHLSVECIIFMQSICMVEKQYGGNICLITEFKHLFDILSSPSQKKVCGTFLFFFRQKVTFC